MASGIVCAVLALTYAAAFIGDMARRRSVSGRKPFTNRDMVSPFVMLIRISGSFERLQPYLQRPRMLLAVLEGGSCPPERLLRWVAEGVAIAYAAMSVLWLLAWQSDNALIGVVGTLIGACLPFLRFRDLNRRVESRKMTLLMELPVLLSRLLVLVNAGENVGRALVRCLERRPSGKHPLYDELHAALAAMERGETMNHAMEEFGRRCAVPEAKLLSAVLFMNARRGGETFVPALRDLTRQMWEKRKAAARTLGEQASSRLAFPLAVVFLLIIVLVGAPALLAM